MLEEAGLRPTTVRQRVLSALFASGRSLSHRELADLLVGLDRVTIFRSLKLLKGAGLVHGVQGVDGTLRYIANPAERRGAAGQSAAGRAATGDRVAGAAGGQTQDAAEGRCPGGHPHFLCLQCGAMTCLADQGMPYLRVPEGAEVRGKQLLIYGICPSCASGKRASSAPRSNRGAMR